MNWIVYEFDAAPVGVYTSLEKAVAAIQAYDPAAADKGLETMGNGPYNFLYICEVIPDTPLDLASRYKGQTQ